MMVDNFKLLMKFRENWEEMSEKTRFVLVGGIGVIIGWAIYNIVFFLNPIEDLRAPTSWFFAAILNVIRQHGLHYWLTFRDHSSRYFPSLMGAFVSYSIGIFLGTLLDFFLTEHYNINHQIAWFIVMLLSLPLSFFMLKRLSFRSHQA